MPQGKLKVKAKLPKNVKSKKDAKKAAATTQRTNRPIQPKKKKLEESYKFKQNVTKALNRAVEQEMRGRAYDGSKKLSKAQEAVATYNATTQAQTSNTAS